MNSIKSLLYLGLLGLVQCKEQPSHKTAQEIYNSGKADLNDFILIKKNNRKIKDYYQYKYDTALILELGYWNTREHIEGSAFYYHGKVEGKMYLYRPNGSSSGEINYKDGKEDGFFIAYDNEKIITKILYKKGNPVYELKYDTLGNITDSIIISGTK